METGGVIKWRIENLIHWSVGVHGECIKSPRFGSIYSFIELYPKGISGQGEHLVVRLHDIFGVTCTDLSFYCSDGSLLCKQLVNADVDKCVLELPPGPKFEDVLSRIQEDFLTVICRYKNRSYYVECMYTTINVLKISLKMNPKWIENIKSDATKDVCYIIFSPNDYSKRMELNTCSKNNIVHFMIKPPPPTKFEYPFAVEMFMRLMRSDDTVDSCIKKEHVFDNDDPWTFSDSLEKKELLGKGISLFLCLKTRDLILSPFYMNWDCNYVSIELNNTLCFSDKAPSTDLVTSNKVEVLTEDSGSQNSLPSDMPEDSVLVLSKELMRLYQDQEFSDITLKCDNVTFPVHKNILSARSPVFKTMLSSDMAEAVSGEVDIGDLDPSTLSRFLTHLYTGSVEEEQQDGSALKLYYAADKYQVPSLKRDCAKFLCSNVSISNVCDILSLADKHSDDELTAASHDFILDNYNDVLKSKEWESFMSSDPLLALKMLTNFASKDCVFARKQESK